MQYNAYSAKRYHVTLTKEFLGILRYSMIRPIREV